MSEASQPPMVWRLCGNQIKLWRTGANITRKELGKEAGYEYETVSSMEMGRRRPTQRLLEVADQMCGAGGKLVASHAYLGSERFAVRSLEFMAIEDEAIALSSYQPLLIPGLLQTEEYARELISNRCPPVEDEMVQVRVAGRLARQQLLKKTAVTFAFIIYEAALHTKVGGREVMRRQLHHLLNVGEQRNVTIRVLPAGLGASPGLAGPLVLVETSLFMHYAYEEGHEAGVLHESPEKVSLLAKRYAKICAQALNTEESAQFISKVANEL